MDDFHDLSARVANVRLPIVNSSRSTTGFMGVAFTTCDRKGFPDSTMLPSIR